MKKFSKIPLLWIAGIVLCVGVVRETQGIIELVNKRYEFEISRDAEEAAAQPKFLTDIDKAISHGVEGTAAISLPVEYEQDYTIYEGGFYVTVDNGQAWLLVPDDLSLGYARISDYADAVSGNNIHLSGEKISVVYGGRGPENISIITTDSRGVIWSVASISQTATHDLETGYGKMHIDFIEDGQTGYLTAVRNEGTAEEKLLVFWSVNSGVTWDSVQAADTRYGEILAHFGLQGG